MLVGVLAVLLVACAVATGGLLYALAAVLAAGERRTPRRTERPEDGPPGPR